MFISQTISEANNKRSTYFYCRKFLKPTIKDVMFILILQTISDVNNKRGTVSADKDVNSIVLTASVPGVIIENLTNPIVMQYRHDLVHILVVVVF